jgi:hypothetical protein
VLDEIVTKINTEEYTERTKVSVKIATVDEYYKAMQAQASMKSLFV